jgi:hypothetical protein
MAGRHELPSLTDESARELLADIRTAVALELHEGSEDSARRLSEAARRHFGTRHVNPGQVPGGARNDGFLQWMPGESFSAAGPSGQGVSGADDTEASDSTDEDQESILDESYMNLAPGLARHLERKRPRNSPDSGDRIARLLMGPRGLDGRLTGSAVQDFVDHRSAVFRKVIDELHDTAGVFVKGLSDQELAERLTDGHYQEYPELTRYLHRVNRRVLWDRNNREEVITRSQLSGSAVVTFHHERNDPHAAQRIADVLTAMETIRAAGYALPEMNFHLPRYRRRLDIGLRSNGEVRVKETELLFDTEAEAFEPNHVIISPDLRFDPATDEVYAVYDRVPNRAVGLAVHETFHVLHFMNDPVGYIDQHRTRFTQRSEKQALASVSEYAAEGGPFEAIAEYATSLVLGTRYDGPIQHLLETVHRRLGGPLPTAGDSAGTR